MSTDYADPLDSDEGVQSARAADDKRAELIRQYREFKQTELFAWLACMADEDEDRATEALVQGNDDDEKQRQIIARCRYFREWVDTGENAINEIDLEPPHIEEQP